MDILIVGGGGQCSVAIDIAEQLAEYRIVGILDDRFEAGKSVMGYEVVGDLSSFAEVVEKFAVEGIVVAIGDNWSRAKVVEKIRERNSQIRFPTLAHPRACVGKNVVLGEGVLLMAGAVVNVNAKIGRFCVLNTNCSVDHDAVLEDYVSFAPNSCAGGAVVVGTYSAICLGANLIDRVHIGAHTVVGAGATVLRDLPEGIVAYGTPAKKIHDREIGQRYL